MDKRDRTIAITIALCATFSTVELPASNMGFRLVYSLRKAGTNGSYSGVNTLALPYIRGATVVGNVNTAFDLIRSIEKGGPPFTKVTSVSKYLIATDTLQAYTGRMGSPGANFSILPGEGYRVQTTADVAYVVVGSHDPTFPVSLFAPGSSSKSGINDFAPPYHMKAASGFALIQDIEGGGPPFSKVISVSKYLIATDTLQTYTGRMGSPGANFTLVPGESYRVQVSVTVPNYVPAHY